MPTGIMSGDRIIILSSVATFAGSPPGIFRACPEAAVTSRVDAVTSGAWQIFLSSKSILSLLCKSETCCCPMSSSCSSRREMRSLFPALHCLYKQTTGS